LRAVFTADADRLVFFTGKIDHGFDKTSAAE
jgi:hypothetical protein